MMNIKKFIQKQRNVSHNPDNPSYKNFYERERLMKFNRFFSQTKVFTGFYFIIAFAVYFLLLWLLQGAENFNIETLVNPDAITNDKISFIDTMTKYWKLELIYLIIAIVGYLRFAYLVKVSQGDINVGQKGTARWTTREELQKQYKWVPENEFHEGGVNYPGMGGIPIARENNKIAIDDSNTNTLIIGTTRSGKGQIVVNPMIDIISRAENKCSMIISDPKLELCNMAIPKLKERGYDCHILNLVDPEFSMLYNPYSTIIEEYKHGDEGTAQQLCASLGYNIFAPQPGEKDPYWSDQARNVFVAVSMAEIEDAIKMDKIENKRRKWQHEKDEKERKEAYLRNLYGADYIKYKIKTMAEDIKRVEKTITNAALAKEILASNCGQDVKLYLAENIGIIEPQGYENEPDKFESNDRECDAFFTSIFELETKENNFRPKDFYEKNENEKKITIYSVIKLCNSLVSINMGREKTMLDYYFESRPEDSFARITYGAVISASENTKGTIMSVFRSKLAVFGFEAIAKMTSESSISFSDIAFGEKPVAIFIGLPDYDKSNWFIATVFINQIYFTLAKLATAMPSGKLPRRVHFILDEFGNLPALDNMSNITTVCLGREMVFTFIIQALAQIDTKYGEEAATIVGNCGNQFFIMTMDNNTAESFSKTLSTESITTTNRTGKKLSINKELTEMTDERPLLSPYELMHLEKGEMIVARGMKREDMQRNAIKPTPIANMGKYRMKFAYEFLGESFPPGQQLYESPNLRRIREKSEAYRNLKVNIVPTKIETTMHIDLKSHARSAQEYVDYNKWKNDPFPCGEDLQGQAYANMNRMFDLINASPREKELYKIAGKMDPQGNGIQYPDMVIKNGALESYAYSLINHPSTKFKNKGFELLNLLLPLKQISNSEEKTLSEIQKENMVIAAMQRKEQ